MQFREGSKRNPNSNRQNWRSTWYYYVKHQGKNFILGRSQIKSTDRPLVTFNLRIHLTNWKLLIRKRSMLNYKLELWEEDLLFSKKKPLEIMQNFKITLQKLLLKKHLQPKMKKVDVPLRLAHLPLSKNLKHLKLSWKKHNRLPLQRITNMKTSAENWKLFKVIWIESLSALKNSRQNQDLLRPKDRIMDLSPRFWCMFWIRKMEIICDRRIKV